MSCSPYRRPPNPPPVDGYRSEFAPLRHVKGLLPPPDPSGPLTTLTSAEYERQQRYDWYQRCWLHGFTLHELRDAGCRYKADAKSSDLNTVVHPLFQNNRWEKKGKLVMDSNDETKGTWEYKNEAVKQAINLSLRLASLLLTNSAFWPWVDALLHGEWKAVLPQKVNDDCPPENAAYFVYSFHPRDSISVKADKEKQIKTIKDLSEKLTLGMESAIKNITEDPRRQLVFAFHRGQLALDGRWTGSTLHLMMETLVPLLRDDLTVSERLAQQFLLARTICHETIHALGA